LANRSEKLPEVAQSIRSSTRLSVDASQNSVPEAVSTMTSLSVPRKAFVSSTMVV